MIGLGLSINTANRTLATQVSAIFRGNGYDGFILDAGDISTLNQVSTGTTPVTAVTQSIGWFGDKHLGMGLGPELSAYSAGFASTTGITGIGATLSISGTSLVVTGTSADGSDRGEIPVSGLTVGKTYKIVVNAKRGAQGTQQGLAQFTFGTIPNTEISTTDDTNYTFIIPATATSGVIRAYASNAVGGIGDVCIVNSISVRLLDGNHALQATEAALPTWQVDANGYHYAQVLGTDDSLSSATGGGGSTGFFFCAALKPTGGAGTLRTIFSDVGTNTGYNVQLDTNNKLSFSAGDNAAFTTKVSTATVDVGTTYLLTCWDDGTNLNVQINSAAAETVARPVVVGDGITYTLFKDDGAASSFAICDFYRGVYFKNTGLTASQRASTQAFVKAGAGL